ncbi:MAG: CoA-binding protein [Oryzomonas sp.]|uniref:CoA-binding protein n=1 Tax=Oryzomonas sp. TaxID=2855186 RepID=UPI00284557CC|nr:CoA-binding protein [Oryzomonas sp.]MDR3579472.1 CoA-binding protein [Oryzomonas sp.]
MTVKQQIDLFLASPAFGVIGASNNRSKYGNKILRCYLQHGYRAIPVNPNEKEIEGIACVSAINELPAEVKSISMITPPEVTAQLVPSALEKGIENIWMQPGAEHPEAVAFCRQHKINVIADGSCLLVVMGYHDH